jgi:hypothetical protein
MPTLGLPIGPQHYQRVHLDMGVYVLYLYSEVIGQNCNIQQGY